MTTRYREQPSNPWPAIIALLVFLAVAVLLFSLFGGKVTLPQFGTGVTQMRSEGETIYITATPAAAPRPTVRPPSAPARAVQPPSAPIQNNPVAAEPNVQPTVELLNPNTPLTDASVIPPDDQPSQGGLTHLYPTAPEPNPAFEPQPEVDIPGAEPKVPMNTGCRVTGAQRQCASME